MPPKQTSIYRYLLPYCSTTQIVAFGNAVIFRPLIEEFNFLCTECIDIITPSFQGKLFFKLALIKEDNIGIHAITGFKKPFHPITLVACVV